MGRRWKYTETLKDWIYRLNTIYSTRSKGLILEVDLEYPPELHEFHNDYPCAAEKLNVTDDMLSTYCKQIQCIHKIKSSTVKKLIPSLNDKK